MTPGDLRSTITRSCLVTRATPCPLSSHTSMPLVIVWHRSVAQSPDKGFRRATACCLSPLAFSACVLLASSVRSTSACPHGMPTTPRRTEAGRLLAFPRHACAHPLSRPHTRCARRPALRSTQSYKRRTPRHHNDHTHARAGSTLHERAAILVIATLRPSPLPTKPSNAPPARSRATSARSRSGAPAYQFAYRRSQEAPSLGPPRLCCAVRAAAHLPSARISGGVPRGRTPPHRLPPPASQRWSTTSRRHTAYGSSAAASRAAARARPSRPYQSRRDRHRLR